MLATNRPEDLDPAVLDRVDISLRIGLPDVRERHALVTLYHSIHFDEHPHYKWWMSWLSSSPQKLPSFRLTEEMAHSVAVHCVGFSGREISKLFIAMQYAVMASEEKKLTESIMQEVLQAKLREHRNLAEFLTGGKEGITQQPAAEIVGEAIRKSSSAEGSAGTGSLRPASKGSRTRSTGNSRLKRGIGAALSHPDSIIEEDAADSAD